MTIRVMAEIGTTGEFVRLPLTGTLSVDVAAAVGHEHPCDDTAACDIAVALENGYPLSAGYLLSGATETPLLDAVYQHYDADPYTSALVEMPEWYAYSCAHSRECESCGSHTYADDRWRIETCGYCGGAMAVTLRDLDTFTRAYLKTALWAETDPDTEEPLDNGHSIEDLSEEVLRIACEDCENFRRDVRADGWTLLNPDNAAHNFWLTRNGHGAGFWDGAYGSAGDPLTKISKAYGDCTLYVGDDGLIYS